jgi:hypothetical protein
MEGGEARIFSPNRQSNTEKADAKCPSSREDICHVNVAW